MHMHTLVPYFHEFFSHSHQNSNLCFHDIFEYLLYCNETSILDYLLMHFKIFTKFLQKKKQRKKMNNQICCTQCGDYGNFLSHFFGKTFVKATFLLKKLLNRWFDEFFLVRVNFSSFHSTLWCTIIVIQSLIFSHAILWKNEKFCFPKIFFSSNQLFSNFFSKNVAFTKFSPKMCETKLQQFPHCVSYTHCVEKRKI